MKKNKIRLIFLVLLFFTPAAYFASGLYSLQSGQHALILRFGKVVDEVYESGMHYCLPAPIEQPVKVHMSSVQTILVYERGDDLMEVYTGDENLIQTRALISYDIKSISDYLLNIQDAKSIIQSAGQMCMSRELAKTTVDDSITKGKSLLRTLIKKNLQETLDDLKTGVRVISVELTDILPPKEITTAFNGVSNARVKKQKIIKDAEGVSNSILPKARGEAGAIISEAEAHAKEVLNAAIARVQSFDNLLHEYNQQPEITKNLKFLETMQSVFNKSRISIDANPSRSTYYIDQKTKD